MKQGSVYFELLTMFICKKFKLQALKSKHRLTLKGNKSKEKVNYYY